MPLHLSIDPPRRRPITWSIATPSRSRLAAPALVLFLAAVFSAGLFPITELDAPWYLRAGEEILRQRGLPAVDPFSYTSHQPWLNHEWLAEIALALGYRLGGVVALGLLQGLVLALCIGALLLARRRSAAEAPAESPSGFLPGLSPLAYAAGAALLREGLAPRAQLFSFLLFSLTLALVLCDEEPRENPRRPDPLWLYVPIGLLWTQFHGGNPGGVLLLCLLFLSGPSLRRAAFAALALLLTCAGPYGLHVHEHYFQARSTLPAIREWMPLSVALRDGAPIYWFALLFLCAAAAAVYLQARRGEPVRLKALALLALTALCAKYVRFIAEATIVAAAILGQALSGPVGPPALQRFVRWGRGAAVLGLSFLLLGAAVAASPRTLGFGFSRDRFPMGAVAYLKQAHPPGPLFNSYNFGGYLLWAYPEERVFIDGRAFTVYSEEQIKELLSVYADPPRFAELQRRYGFRLAVLQRLGRGRHFLGWLRQQPGWRVAYEDKLAAVLVRGP